MTEPEENQVSQDEIKKRAVKRVGVAVALAAVAAVGLTMLSYSNKPAPQPQQTVLPAEPAPQRTPASAVAVAEPPAPAPSAVAEALPEKDEPPTTAPPPPPQVINQQASAPATKPAKQLAQKSGHEADGAAAPTLVPAVPDKATKTRPPEATPATKDTAARASEAAARVAETKKPAEPPKSPEPPPAKPMPVEKSPPPPPQSGGGGGGSGKGYAVQLGVFSNPTNALQMQEKLTQQGIQSYTETKLNVGPFKNKAEAEQAMAKVRGLGINAVLVPLK